MMEPQSIEEFEHFHADGMTHLRLEELKLKTMDTLVGLAPLDNQLKQTLSSVLQSIPATGRVDPEVVFRAAISSLPALDAQGFLIDNFLEALKRGDDLQKTIDCYRALGLLRENLAPNATLIPLTGLGAQIEERKGLWRRVNLKVMRIGANAIKSIPKWIEIEPQIILFPVPGFGLTLKGKGIPIQDIFDAFCVDPKDDRESGWR